MNILFIYNYSYLVNFKINIYFIDSNLIQLNYLNKKYFNNNNNNKYVNNIITYRLKILFNIFNIFIIIFINNKFYLI